MTSTIPVLDLFSGIGGFSLALGGAYRTVAYCERDPACRAVLKARIVDGRLDRAPIFHDVTTLRARHLPATGGDRLLVTAGFPCQDISAGNHGTGLDGERSRLFFEVVRLIDELGDDRVGGVFLENSPCIRKRGMRQVLNALRCRGFRCRWGLFTPAELQAPQRRWRWFLLGRRPGFKYRPVAVPPAPWAREPPASQRLSRTVGADEVERRCGMLGNSVCPPVVARALMHFLRGAEKHHRCSAARLDPPAALLRLLRPGREDEVVWARRMWSTPVRHPLYWQVLAKDLEKGQRSCRNLWNQLAYEAGTLAAMRRLHGAAWVPTRDWRVDPAWVEWLMGYPAGWTASAAGSAPAACA